MNLITENFNDFQVRILLIELKEWFVAKDIAELLEYKRTADAITQHCKKPIEWQKLKVGEEIEIKFHPQTKVILEPDVLLLISKSQNKSESEKYKIIKKLGLSKKFILHSRDEINFLYSLQEALSPFNLVVKTQFKVDKYFVDFYIPSKILSLNMMKIIILLI